MNWNSKKTKYADHSTVHTEHSGIVVLYGSEVSMDMYSLLVKS